MFIPSAREGNFNLFNQILQNLLPYFFLDDHTHSSQWRPIFIQGSQQLDKDDTVFSEFRKGHFTVNKSKGSFSGI